MAASAGRTFRKIEMNFLNLGPENPQIEGLLSQKGTMKFGENFVGRYTLLDDDGLSTTILGATGLDDVLENVPEGTYVRITYQGLITTRKGMKMKDFSVEVAE